MSPKFLLFMVSMQWWNLIFYINKILDRSAAIEGSSRHQSVSEQLATQVVGDCQCSLESTSHAVAFMDVRHLKFLSSIGSLGKFQWKPQPPQFTSFSQFQLPAPIDKWNYIPNDFSSKNNHSELWEQWLFLASMSQTAAYRLSKDIYGLTIHGSVRCINAHNRLYDVQAASVHRCWISISQLIIWYANIDVWWTLHVFLAFAN